MTATHRPVCICGEYWPCSKDAHSDESYRADGNPPLDYSHAGSVRDARAEREQAADEREWERGR